MLFYLAPFCSDLFVHSQFYEVPFCLTPFGSDFLGRSQFYEVPFCLTLFGSDFFLPVIFERCHFVSDTVSYGIFGPQSFPRDAIFILLLLAPIFLATVIF